MQDWRIGAGTTMYYSECAFSRTRTCLVFFRYVSGLQKYPKIRLELQTEIADAGSVLRRKPLACFSSYPRIFSVKAIDLCVESAAAEEGAKKSRVFWLKLKRCSVDTLESKTSCVSGCRFLTECRFVQLWRPRVLGW
jgi:hypothetical protein